MIMKNIEDYVFNVGTNSLTGHYFLDILIYVLDLGIKVESLQIYELCMCHKTSQKGVKNSFLRKPLVFTFMTLSLSAVPPMEKVSTLCQCIYKTFVSELDPKGFVPFPTMYTFR